MGINYPDAANLRGVFEGLYKEVSVVNSELHLNLRVIAENGKCQMELNPENRETPRFEHEATVMIENYPSGKYYEGRMYNYSRAGMYFESDFEPAVGADIFIGIENSPYSSSHDVRRAKVMWCTKLPDNASYFYYGVGIKYH